MKLKLNKSLLLVILMMLASLLGIGLSAYAADSVNPIPPGPETVLPDYIGAPAKPHPLANSSVPQNPLLALNPFNSIHNDLWNSDADDITGLLGRDPIVLSSTLAEARQNPLPPEWIFVCITEFFDSHGRVIAVCFGPNEATVVLADADTLEVLSHYHLPSVEGSPYIEGGRQTLLRSKGASCSYFDARDRVILGGGNKLLTLVEGGTDASPVLQLDEDNSYDLSTIIPSTRRIAGVMLDEQRRIWFDTVIPATIWMLNPATYEQEGVKKIVLADYEEIRNTFAVMKTGVDSSAAYVVTSKKMYRVEAGADAQPYVVWSEPYDSIGMTKEGQYEPGSGTSPTILGEGKYVAVTDNADPLKVMVFRTSEQLDPNEQRIVCEVPVFEEQVGGASSNSLVGSRLSLIATNNYYYLFDWKTGQMIYPSAPGVERIDIDPNGKGCRKVWANEEVATSTSARVSTRSGLIYSMAREYDDENNVHVYYWIALDFRTGETVWKKMAGTGDMFDSFYPALTIGPNGALFYGAYGGLTMIMDTPDP